MRSCEQCGRRADPDDSFCHSCGGYLGWHDTATLPDQTSSPRAAPALTATPPPRRPTEPPRGEPVTGHPQQGSTSSDRYGVALSMAADTVEVEPGGEARLEVSVRNLGSLVDQFQVRVTGPPGAWVEAEPPTVAVFPGQEVPVTLHFRPPREVRVPAGTAPFRVVASSVLHRQTSAEQTGQLHLAAVSRLEADVTRRLAATDSADFHVVLHNRGNTDAKVSLRPGGAHYEMEVGFRPEKLLVPAFGVAAATLRVRAPRKDPEDSRAYPLQVQAMVEEHGHEVVGATAEAVFVHEPGAPPRLYGVTLLGWLVGGLLVGVVVALVALVALVAVDLLGDEVQPAPPPQVEPVDGQEVVLQRQSRPEFDIAPQLPAALGIGAVGFVLGSTWGAWRALRLREAVRGGLTCLLVGLATLIWAGSVALAALVGAFAVALLLLLLNPALAARWLALRGLPRPPPRHASAPELVAARGRRSRSAVRGPAARPTAPTGGAVPSRPASPAVSASPARSAVVPRPAGRPAVETHGLADLAAGGPGHERPAVPRRPPPSRRLVLLASGPVAVVLLYLFVGLPGTLTGDVNLRPAPGTSRDPLTQIRAGTAAVTVRCVVDDSWVAVTFPQPGYVTTQFLERLPARPCLP